MCRITKLQGWGFSRRILSNVSEAESSMVAGDRVPLGLHLLAHPSLLLLPMRTEAADEVKSQRGFEEQ